ncbi:unnamed protein product, partial [Coregonus sp. 'balchen']
ELCVIFPWLVERVVGSLDGSIVGWSLSSLHAHSSDYNNILEFLQQRSSTNSETSKGLFKRQCPVNTETTNQGIWRQCYSRENILMYTELFRCFLKRFAHVDLLNIDNATMVFRMAKVFAQSSLSEFIENGENVLLHQGPLIPSTLMAFQVQPTEKGTLPPTQDIHNKELQMFGIEMRAHVLKLVQRLMQAQQTAKTTLDQPANASVGQFLCSWIRSILKTNSENGANDMTKSDMKTVELLKKAEDHLNEVFESENRLILTDLGRMQ